MVDAFPRRGTFMRQSSSQESLPTIAEPMSPGAPKINIRTSRFVEQQLLRVFNACAPVGGGAAVLVVLGAWCLLVADDSGGEQVCAAVHVSVSMFASQWWRALSWPHVPIVQVLVLRL